MRVGRLIVLIAFIGSTLAGAARQSPVEIKVWTARAIATVLAEIGPEYAVVCHVHRRRQRDIEDAGGGQATDYIFDRSDSETGDAKAGDGGRSYVFGEPPLLVGACPRNNRGISGNSLMLPMVALHRRRSPRPWS